MLLSAIYTQSRFNNLPEELKMLKIQNVIENLLLITYFTLTIVFSIIDLAFENKTTLKSDSKPQVTAPEMITL